MARPMRKMQELQDDAWTPVRSARGGLRLVEPLEPELRTHEIRTCARCGARTWFRLEDPEGGWYTCSRCGCYA